MAVAGDQCFQPDKFTGKGNPDDMIPPITVFPEYLYFSFNQAIQACCFIPFLVNTLSFPVEADNFLVIQILQVSLIE